MQLTNRESFAVREPSVELLRIAAAFGVVWYHAQVPGHDLAYSGLIVFVLLTFAFACGPNLRRPVAVPDLARRLLLPWGTWWLVFGLINGLRGRPVIDTANGWIAGILAGPSIHLWYLPFAFATVVAVGVLKPVLSPRVLAFSAASVATALLIAMPIWRPESLDCGAPVAQYLHALPPVALGALLGLQRYGRFERVCLAVAIAALLLVPALGFPDVGVPYLVGTALVAVALAASSLQLFAPGLDLRPVSGAMLGVYLVHPLALKAVKPLLQHAPPLGVVAAFALSTLFVLVVRKAAPRAAALTVG
jgi:hypothetical protein